MNIHIEKITVSRDGPLAEDFELECGELNLIYGQNESGKSYIVESLIESLFRTGGRGVPDWPLRPWLFAALLSPFVTAFATDIGRLKTRPVGALDTLEANPQGEDEAGLLAALEDESEQGPLTVAYLRSGMGGGMFPLFSITDAGAHMVLDGHIAAVNFEHRLRRSATGYDALGGSHVIYDRDFDDPAFTQRLTEVGRFGHYHLARYTPRNPPSRVSVDRGSARVVRDSAEDVVVEVETDARKETVQKLVHVVY